MIITEYFNDGTLVHFYSDSNLKIIQNETGNIYADAIDVIPCMYTYSESNIEIEDEELEEHEIPINNVLK